MKKIKITQFKTNALKIMDQVVQTQEGIIITRQGKPLVQIVPCCKIHPNPLPGRLENTFVFEKDIVSPLGEDLWDSCK